MHAQNPASVERPSLLISVRLRVSSPSRGAGAFYTRLNRGPWKKQPVHRGFHPLLKRQCKRQQHTSKTTVVCPVAFVSCDGCAARGGGHSLSFPSLHPLLSPTVLHRGALEEPSRHYCLFGVKVRPGRRCERKAVKNLPDPPRAAGKLHRGQIRCSAYAWVRSRESIVNAPAKQRWTGSEGTPRKARPIRGDGTTSGRTRHTLGHSAHADHACATPTWEVGGCTPWALLMRRSLATGTKMGECAPSIGPIVPPLRLQKPEQDEASV